MESILDASTQKAFSISLKAREQHRCYGLSVRHFIAALPTENALRDFAVHNPILIAGSCREPDCNGSCRRRCVVNSVNPTVYSFNHDVTNTPIEVTARQHFSIVPRSAVGEFARKIARKQKVEISWMRKPIWYAKCAESYQAERDVGLETAFVRCGAKMLTRGGPNIRAGDT